VEPVNRESGEDPARDRLLRLRRELEVALAGSVDRAAVVELDQSAVGRRSRGDALQAQAMARAEAERAAQRLEAVDHALARLDHGRYGVCLRCGDDIAPARLDARPEVPFCLACAR
jgi:DnaK suppressor protein